jgi:hypothetical protein
MAERFQKALTTEGTEVHGRNLAVESHTSGTVYATGFFRVSDAKKVRAIPEVSSRKAGMSGGLTGLPPR